MDTLKSAVDQLTAGGSTNHADAFTQAIQVFDPASSNGKVIVMFTDGKTTAGPPPSPVAAEARALGIVIYCIGLTGADGIDISVLNDWATDPDTSHVAVTPDDADLEQLFADLAKNISKPGAKNIVIDEVIHPDFAITNLVPPSKGTAMMVNANTLQWKIPELGVSGNEGALLEFYIRHIGTASGAKEINESISYKDTENNAATFPSPSVTVDCGIVIQPENCPCAKEVKIDKCKDSIVVDLGDVYLESQGRIVQINVTLKNVCPDKRVALAVILTEVDCKGKEYQRGMKTFTIPAHHSPGCRDILVKCIKFVLPEDLNVSGGCPRGLCSTSFELLRLLHFSFPYLFSVTL